MLKQAFEVLKVIGMIAATFAAVGAVTWPLSLLAQWIVSLTNETSFHITPAVNALAAATAISVMVLLIAWIAFRWFTLSTFFIVGIACICMFFWSRVHLFPGTPVSGFVSQLIYSLGFAVLGLVAFLVVLYLVLWFTDDTLDNETDIEADALALCS